MVFVITDSGNSEGYGKPLAMAYNREQVNKFCEKSFVMLWREKGTTFVEVNLTVKIEKPFGWREQSAIISLEGITEGDECNCVASYEVYKVMNLEEPDSFEALDFFGE